MNTDKTSNETGKSEAVKPASVRPVLGVVLDRNGWPTLVARGNEEDHVRHAGASYLYDQAAIDAAVAAEREQCAKLCERQDWSSDSEGDYLAGREFAKRIRYYR